MKIKLLSDLHFEYHRDNGREFIKKNCQQGEADVLVLAGDINASKKALQEALKMFNDLYPHVLFVPGNHDYYFKSIYDLDDVDTLQNRSVTIDGVKFIGSTLWFKHQEASLSLESFIEDFKYISDFDPQKLHNEMVKFLWKEIHDGDVVISHHLPLLQCISPKYADSIINCFFATDQEELILTTNPKYWLFGHTHLPCDLRFGKTKLLCNPYGYPHEMKSLKAKSLIIEV